jgi:hypothetical protein
VATVTKENFYFFISVVTKNSAENYWGLIDGGTYSGSWVYMGNLRNLNLEVNVSSVFLKQENTKTCTLCSATMLLRRYAIVCHKDYKLITESEVRKVAWGSNGLKGTFTYGGVKVTYYSGEFKNLNYEDKRAKLIEMLHANPEGIVLYDSHKPHAVLLLDYDEVTDTFYIADPATGKGRVPLDQSTTLGTGQQCKIENLDKIWYIPEQIPLY